MVLSRSATFSVLFLINLLNYVDRYTVAGILSHLQAPLDAGGLGIKDAQGGLLSSIFILSYIIFSPIFGFFGDRSSRKHIIFYGVVVWSLSTFLASFAESYLGLLLFRFLLGIGEASYATVTPTIIADLYPITERTRMLSIYYIAVPLGSALGFIAAGEAAYYLDWRWAFRLTPPITIILGLIIVFLMKNPDRGGIDGIPDIQVVVEVKRVDNYKEFLEDFALVWQNNTFFWSTMGLTAITFVVGALAQWGPMYFQRVQCTGLPTDVQIDQCRYRINLTFGMISCFTGIFGTLLGAAISKKYSTPRNAADSVICSMGLFFTAPSVFAAVFLGPIVYELSWVFTFVGQMTLSLTWAPVTAMLMYCVRPRLRSLASGLQTLFSHLFGDAASPIIIGVVADMLSDVSGAKLTRAKALQYALLPLGLWCIAGGMCFLKASQYLVKDRRRVMDGDSWAQTESLTGGFTVIDSSEEENLIETDRINYADDDACEN